MVDVREIETRLENFVKMFPAYRSLPIFVVAGRASSAVEMLGMVRRGENLEAIAVAIRERGLSPPLLELTLAYYEGLAVARPNLAVAVLGYGVVPVGRVVDEIRAGSSLGVSAVEQQGKLILRARSLLML